MKNKCTSISLKKANSIFQKHCDKEYSSIEVAVISSMINQMQTKYKSRYVLAFQSEQQSNRTQLLTRKVRTSSPRI